MTNSQRQPRVEKAIGNPNKGKPASTVTKADTAPNRLQGKPLSDGNSTADES